MFQARLLVHVVHQGRAQQRGDLVDDRLLHQRGRLDPIRREVLRLLRAAWRALLLVPQGLNFLEASLDRKRFANL